MGKVLAVDDDPDILALVRLVLQQGGHEASTASTADDALTLLRQESWDCMLLDVMMPGRDGFTLLDQVKADPTMSQVPVVMVTARAAPRDKLIGGVGGALFYVTKPFVPADLLRTVDEVLSSDTPERERRQAVQRRATSQLAQLEAGREGAPNPRLASLGHRRDPDAPARVARSRLDRLTDIQRDLVLDLGRGNTVRTVAKLRGVTRSSLYAHLRRIHRKLGTGSTEDLAALARESGLLTE